MGADELDVLKNIAQITDSEIILFFIILTVVMVVFFLPLYNMIMKEKKEKNNAENERLDRYIQREAQIINVITQNTEAISSLKAALVNYGANTDKSVDRIHERINRMSADMQNIMVLLSAFRKTGTSALNSKKEKEAV